MNNQQRDELLMKIYQEQQEMKANYQEMKQDQQEMKKEMQEMKQGQQEMKKEMQEMKQDQQEMKKEFQNMKEEQQELRLDHNDMHGVLMRLCNTVTRMEYENGRKLDLILEVLTGHGVKIEEHDDRFEKDEKILDTHSHQIYGLEQKMQA